MVADSLAAKRLVVMCDEERNLLESRDGRSFILRRVPAAAGIAPEIAPGLTTLTVCCPTRPFITFCFTRGQCQVVMTSANVSDRPIIYENEKAIRSLSGVADAFLTHDRDIHVRNDDSIVRVISGAPVVIRRSRGFVPEPLPCPCNVDSLVALGGVLKSTVALGKKRNCYCSPYIGAVETLEDVSALDHAITHLTRTLGVTPSLYVCDLHPHSLVSSYAVSTGARVAFVQHHHAHAAACMADNEIADKTLCIVFDGTGYGDDGTLEANSFMHPIPDMNGSDT